MDGTGGGSVGDGSDGDGVGVGTGAETVVVGLAATDGVEPGTGAAVAVCAPVDPGRLLAGAPGRDAAPDRAGVVADEPLGGAERCCWVRPPVGSGGAAEMPPVGSPVVGP